jgi:hypothetical protein
MDERLHRTQIMIETLAGEVSRGSFRQGPRPQGAIGWQRDGILFATEASDNGDNPDGRRAIPLTILTPHAHEAGWLLDKLHEAFQPLLDRCIERDFYERIAEAALEYCGYVDLEDSTDINLLKILLAEAGDVLEEMLEGEFPYTSNGAVS